ncbi:MAG TPA: hypothetical protein VFH62_04210 [Dehalococcoidia bacterium]|jgi:hypothetical protein|nr:hypothetical protein [Dehalococcoidia bacterium]
MSHIWVTFALGRRCTECGLTQENGAFDDDIPCTPKRPAPRRAPRETSEKK